MTYPEELLHDIIVKTSQIYTLTKGMPCLYTKS